jgi:putative transposase
MAKIFHPLLALIASATDRELAKHVQFLKEENKILRARVPGQIHTRPGERERLIKFGKAIGRAVEELITIVTPGTFYRWLREQHGQPNTNNPKGGQRKPREIRELVILIAKTTGFGYTRILGELRNILKEAGIEPGPERQSDCWNEFIGRHAETLWACDFFSVKTVTTRGFQRMYVLVFLCLETREVIVSPATDHPNSAWVVKQAEAFADQTANREKQPDIVLHDRDTKFTKEFVNKLKDRGLRPSRLPIASPNLNGRCERFIQTIKLEHLTKCSLTISKNTNRCASVLNSHNAVRSHTERNHLPPIHDNPEEVDSLPLDQIEIKSYVGGLVKSFERNAA